MYIYLKFYYERPCLLLSLCECCQCYPPDWIHSSWYCSSSSLLLLLLLHTSGWNQGLERWEGSSASSSVLIIFILNIRGEKEESRREQRILWYIIIGEQERIKHFVNFWRSRDLSFLLWSYCDDKGSLQKNKIKKIYKFAFHVNQVYCADFKIIRQKNKIIISTILWVEASNGFRP